MKKRKSSEDVSSQPSTIIQIRLTPRSSQNRISGGGGGPYTIKVTAPPVNGRANEALIALLAETLTIPKRRITIISGKTARLKMIRIDGLSSEEIDASLGNE